MDKTIGKWWYTIFLVWSSWTYAGMSLQLVDTQGMPIEQIAAGQPFRLEVIVTDVASFNQYPRVVGIEKFSVKNTGMRITTVNGRTTAHYSYELRIDTPGNYLLGPAELTLRGDVLTSNKVTVRVGDETIRHGAAPEKSKRKHEAAFIRLATDKQHVVAGERIACQLRFYFTDPRLGLKQLIVQESKQLIRKPMRGPFTGTETINGTVYNYAEWTWDSYINTPGRQVIPAYGIDYEREAEENRSYWGGFARFFGNQVEQKRIYSNAVTLQVDPLPVQEGIQGVGTFSSFELSAHPSVAKQGEGIIIALELVGNGNVHEVNIPQLQGVPQELRYYESKQSVQEPEDKDDSYKKRFEFVVQGLKIGSWELPSQNFTYYDVENRTVRTIKSAPLTLTIMPGIAKSTVSLDDDLNKEKKMIAPLHEQGPWHPAPVPWRFSWGMIWLLMLLPIALLILRGMMIHFKRRVKVPYEIIREKYAFSHAKKQFDTIKRERDARRLYALFVELIANKCKTSLGEVTAPFIATHLRDKKLPEHAIEQWNLFFKTITERAYGSSQAQIDEELFKQAEQWLNDLQKVL